MSDLVRFLGRTISEIASDPFVVSLESATALRQVDDQCYYVCKDAGIEFGASRHQIITDIHLFSDGHQGYRGYKASLPEALDFLDSRITVRSKLGTPDATAGGTQGTSKILKTPPIDRYDRPLYSLGLEFSDNEDRILSVIIQQPVPRKGHDKKNVKGNRKG